MASGAAEREVEHGAQVLLELAGGGAVDRPVPAVVRAHGELVHEDAVVGGLEELDGEHAGDPESFGDRDGDRRPRHPRAVPADRGAGAMTSLQTPSTLHGLDDGPGRHLARGTAGDELGELAAEVDELLDEEGAAAAVLGDRGEPVATSAAARTTRTPLPS